MHTQTVQFTIVVKDKYGNNYHVSQIDPNEMYEIQELIKCRSVWINMVGRYSLGDCEVCLESKNHSIHVNAQLQIDVPPNVNMEMIIENGKINFNNDLSAEYMLLSNGDTIGMNIV